MEKHHGIIGRCVYRFGAGLDSAIRVLALQIPGPAPFVNLHGGGVRDALLLHRARLRAVIRPYEGEGLGDLAGEWNADQAEAGSSSTSGGSIDDGSADPRGGVPSGE